MNNTRRLGLLTIVTTMIAMPLATGIAGAEPEAPPTEAVAPTDEAQLPDEFTSQYYNGENSSVAEFPFIIAGLRTPGARPQGQSCTGSVIAPRKILTAAHCKDADGEKSYLYGLDDLNDGGGTRLEVESYIQHPKYVNFDQGYDVAVVTTKQDIPVPNGEYAEFATSDPKYADLNDPGKTGVGVGYGKKTHNDSPADVTVDKASLPIVDGSRQCTGVGAGFQDATMVCAGYSDGRKTILPGDSGGPLVVDGVVVGVGSWSRSDFRWYSIYGRLNNDMGDWVKQQVGEQPPDDGEFSLSVVPGSVSVEPGGFVSATVYTTAGEAGVEDIALSASGLPSGTEAVFQPSTVAAGKTAKLTLDTATSTPTGTSTVTVT
ncbi:trypsin-like serine protease, partial [Amycolatopsis palatopharyngis]|uniref:trypsin-like serine protease n=1 Tax=Amycolatopsis palatopharyngis TaxID=187982 RepID=UPI001FEC0777